MPTATAKAWLFLAVPLGVLTAFVLGPTLLGILAAFFEWDGAGQPRFIGLTNFAALAQDRTFWTALRNTLIFAALTVPVQVVLGFLLAVAVNAEWFRGRALVRTMLFMPTVVSIVSVGFIWRWVLDDNGGLAPGLLRSVGVDPPQFLQSAEEPIPGVAWPMLSIAGVQVWRMAGFCMVLYLAALQSVSPSLYEAAEIDGASRWQIVRRVTWPSVAPMTSFLAVTGVIGAIQVFDIVWAMTAEGETDATRVLNTMIFREFQQSRYGYASAIGVAIFCVTAAAITLPRLVRGREQ